jgi:DNA-binding NtrC family response regulator
VVNYTQVLAALEKTKGNKSHAAKALGISRQALYRVLGKLAHANTDANTDGPAPTAVANDA